MNRPFFSKRRSLIDIRFPFLPSKREKKPIIKLELVSLVADGRSVRRGRMFASSRMDVRFVADGRSVHRGQTFGSSRTDVQFIADGRSARRGRLFGSSRTDVRPIVRGHNLFVNPYDHDSQRRQTHVEARGGRRHGEWQWRDG